MKTYPYQTPDGIIQLVEKHEIDQLIERLAKAEELLREIRDDEVNAQDEADKFIRDHQPSDLSLAISANAELLERLAEARESHLAASARDVQTIQQQSVLIARLYRAISVRMSAEEPTGEERLELMHAWEEAGAFLDQSAKKEKPCRKDCTMNGVFLSAAS